MLPQISEQSRFQSTQKKLEQSAKEFDQKTIDAETDSLLAQYQNLLTEIKELLITRGILPKPNDYSDKPSISKKDLLDKIAKSLDALEGFDSRECQHILSDILEYNIHTTLHDKLQEILQKLKLYEDDDAEALLRQTLQEEKQNG